MSTIPSWAVKGRKVICIDAKLHDPRCQPMEADERLTEGEIYTITGVLVDDENACVLHLAEVRRNAKSRREWGEDAGYGVYRFRPLITLEHDMAVHFSALLDVPASHEVDA